MICLILSIVSLISIVLLLIFFLKAVLNILIFPVNSEHLNILNTLYKAYINNPSEFKLKVTEIDDLSVLYLKGNKTRIYFWPDGYGRFIEINSKNLNFRIKFPVLGYKNEKKIVKDFWELVKIRWQKKDLMKPELVEALPYYPDPGDCKSPYTGDLDKLYFDCGGVARKALPNFEKREENNDT